MELFEEILKDDILELGGKKFRSRLIVGTGKYENMENIENYEKRQRGKAPGRIPSWSPSRQNYIAHFKPL